MGSVVEVVAPVSVLSWRTVGALFVAWIVYHFIRALYNASPLHPLSKIPGPKLAAASYLYEFWFDFVRKGRYTHEIRRMHEIYGLRSSLSRTMTRTWLILTKGRSFASTLTSCIATTPTSLTKSTPSMGGNVTNTRTSLRTYLPPHAGTVDHDLHRRRRGAMNKFFSRLQMFKLEPKVHALAQRLCDKLIAGASNPDKIVPLTEAYSCFTSDVVSEYCFGEAFGFLKQEDWTPNFRDAVYGQLNHMFIFKFFPWLKGRDIPRHVEQARERKGTGSGDGKDTNVFAELFDSDLPPEEKTTKRLTAEGVVVMVAGTETTSFTLTVITFYLLTKPEILEKLTQELRTVVRDPEHLPSWPTLEALPYFSAVISEGLRLAPGVASRTSRVATEEDLVYRGKWTPKGSETEVELNYVIPRGMGWE
ncbi:trichodiene oxygenase [Colletotrichum tofieldiae]|nr:trichodiene oxygenase [Colletotrichum tofieldiae]